MTPPPPDDPRFDGSTDSLPSRDCCQSRDPLRCAPGASREGAGSSLRRNRSLTLAALVGAGAVAVAACSGFNPFVVLIGGPLGFNAIPPQIPPAGVFTTSSGFPTVCTYQPPNTRFIRLTLRNESRAEVAVGLALLATVGLNGFVCESERPTYLDAGYEIVPVDASLARTFGCDRVSREAGVDLIALRTLEAGQTLTIPAAAMAGGMGVAPPPFDGSIDIPIPTVILLGTDDEFNNIFSCTTVDSCTAIANQICAQGGFVYQTTPPCRIPASRTQGTLCHSRTAARPRWLLRNSFLEDRTAQTFEYFKGARIIITVLDRANNTNPSANQIVWQVSDLSGRIIHQEQR